VKLGRKQVRCCAICGSRKNLQEHHLGGFRHTPFFTIPLCEPHHQAVHLAITRAGVNLRYTNNLEERARGARMAAYVFLWFLDEQLAAAEKPNSLGG
jgi:hypothetical protein